MQTVVTVRNKLLRDSHQRFNNLLRADDNIDLLERLVTSLLASIVQPYYKMITTCSKLDNNNWEQALREHIFSKKLRDFCASCIDDARFILVGQMIAVLHTDICLSSLLSRTTRNALIFYKITRKSLYYY